MSGLFGVQVPRKGLRVRIPCPPPSKPSAPDHGLNLLAPDVEIFHATALMFVAYTGYGRIATLGEEVTNPRRTIPRAIVMTLVVSALLYVLVGVVFVNAGGADETAPLELIAQRSSMVSPMPMMPPQQTLTPA